MVDSILCDHDNLTALSKEFVEIDFMTFTIRFEEVWELEVVE